jgi:hypothetical protein
MAFDDPMANDDPNMEDTNLQDDQALADSQLPETPDSDLVDDMRGDTVAGEPDEDAAKLSDVVPKEENDGSD